MSKPESAPASRSKLVYFKSFVSCKTLAIQHIAIAATMNQASAPGKSIDINFRHHSRFCPQTSYHIASGFRTMDFTAPTTNPMYIFEDPSAAIPQAA